VLQALREDWPLFASQLVSALYTVSGPIVVDQIAGAHAAGRYSAVERVISALAAACQLTYVAAWPRLAGCFAADRPAYSHLLKQVMATYVAGTTLIALAVWLGRDPLFAFLFGSAAAEVRPGALLAWGLAWLVAGIAGPALTGYLTLSGRKAQVMTLNLGVLATCALLGIPSVLAFGPAGWMAALVGSQLVVLAAAIYHWRRRDGPGERV